METNICIAMARAKVKSFKDLQEQELIIGIPASAPAPTPIQRRSWASWERNSKLIPDFPPSTDVGSSP